MAIETRDVRRLLAWRARAVNGFRCHFMQQDQIIMFLVLKYLTLITWIAAGSRRRQSPIRGRGAGLRRKLMLRLVVTASGTQPIEARSAMYIVTSASIMRTGPETVPPGRVAFVCGASRT